MKSRQKINANKIFHLLRKKVNEKLCALLDAILCIMS